MYRNSMLKGGLYMNIQKELSKGSSSLLVLSVLGTGDMYGYQIIKEIEQRSEFVFSFKEGTLYPILHGFEQEGLVKSYWQDGERGKRRSLFRQSAQTPKSASRFFRRRLSRNPFSPLRLHLRRRPYRPALFGCSHLRCSRSRYKNRCGRIYDPAAPRG